MKNNVFDDRFIKLARSVYITNDQRFDTKIRLILFFHLELLKKKIMKNIKLFIIKLNQKNY